MPNSDAVSASRHGDEAFESIEVLDAFGKLQERSRFAGANVVCPIIEIEHGSIYQSSFEELQAITSG